MAKPAFNVFKEKDRSKSPALYEGSCERLYHVTSDPLQTGSRRRASGKDLHAISVSTNIERNIDLDVDPAAKSLRNGLNIYTACLPLALDRSLSGNTVAWRNTVYRRRYIFEGLEKEAMTDGRALLQTIHSISIE